MSGIESDSAPVKDTGPAHHAAAVIDAIVRGVAGLAVAVLAVMVVYVVAARYLFGVTPRWSEELPRLLLVWTTFLGTVSGFVRGGHFRAGLRDLLLAPGPLRAAARVVAGLATVAFLVTLAITGTRITLLTWPHATTALGLPGGLFYIMLPIGAVLALLGFALVGWRR